MSARSETRRTGPVGVAVIGAGVISKEYLTNLTSFPDVTVHIVADMFEEVAAARAAEFGVQASGGVEDALNHPDVEIVVNLTIPAAHVEVATAAVAAGKHVWSEKPFSLDRESGIGLLKTADASELIGAARACVDGETVLAPAVLDRVIGDFVQHHGVRAGSPGLERLTERETEVLTLMCTGMSNAEIAEHLVVEVATVKTHVARILQKLPARDRLQAVVHAFHAGLDRPAR